MKTTPYVFMSCNITWNVVNENKNKSSKKDNFFLAPRQAKVYKQMRDIEWKLKPINCIFTSCILCTFVIVCHVKWLKSIFGILYVKSKDALFI